MSRTYETAFDFDGVVTEGVLPTENDVIITGNTQDKEQELRSILKELNAPQVPIFFYPDKKALIDNPEKIDELVGIFKGNTAKKLGVKKFFEDSPIQAKFIKKLSPETEIVLVKPNKMNFIVFAFEGIFFPVAKKLQDEGNSVVIAQIEDIESLGNKDKPEESESKKRRLSLYDGMLNKQPVLKVLKAMKKIKNKDDYFVVIEMNYLWRYAEACLKLGYKVGFFPTKEDYAFEKDRQMAKDFVKKNYPKLKVAEVQEFKSVEDGIKFLEETDKFWVLKSQGDSGDTVVPITEDIELAKQELIGALKTDAKNYEHGGFILEQKIINPIEITPEMVFWNGKPVFSDIDIEAKPLGAGDKGPMTGCASDLVLKTELNEKINEIAFPPVIYEMAKKHKGLFVIDAGMLWDGKNFYFTEFCFDSKTEMITKEGWKFYQDIKIGDETLAFNPQTMEMEWKPIIKKSVLHYEGDMIKIGNKDFDALVTPEHQLWVKTRSGKMVLQRAGKLGTGVQIPRTAFWEGNNVPEIILKPIDVFVFERITNKGEWKGGGKYGIAKRKVKKFYRHTLPEIKLKTEDISWLLGLWIAEGSFTSYYKREPRGIVIAQSLKNPKREIIQKRLDNIGILYKISRNGNFEINNRRLAIYFWNELGLKNTHAESKFIPTIFKELSPYFLKEFLDGYWLGDGSVKKEWMVCSTSKRLADDLQEIIHKCGWVANIKINNIKGTSLTINGKTYIRRHNAYLLSIKKKKLWHQKNGKSHKGYERVFYNGLVWDVTVADYHTLFVRRNGKAFFSSNCPNRFGWDAFPTELAMSGDKDGKKIASRYFEAIIKGKNPLKWNYGIAVRMFNMSPDDKHTKLYSGGNPIHWKDEADPDVYAYDIKKDKDFVNVGTSKDLAVITGFGNDIQSAIDSCYAYVDMFSFSDVMYRPKFDVESLDYPTSIMNRYNALVGKFFGEK